jgi:HdeA/HdeB family
MRWMLIVLVALAALPARAAGLDMGTQTCRDWLDADDDTQEQMVAWLRGYLAGRSSYTVYDPAKARADAQTLRSYCQAHQDIGVVSAASQMGR